MLINLHHRGDGTRFRQCLFVLSTAIACSACRDASRQLGHDRPSPGRIALSQFDTTVLSIPTENGYSHIQRIDFTARDVRKLIVEVIAVTDDTNRSLVTKEAILNENQSGGSIYFAAPTGDLVARQGKKTIQCVCRISGDELFRMSSSSLEPIEVDSSFTWHSSARTSKITIDVGE
mgnify:CR=1 FL=1